jgi:hypothetical protein
MGRSESVRSGALGAEDRCNIPAVDLLGEVLHGFPDFRLTRLHAEQHLGLVREREIVKVEGLARPDADPSELGTNAYFLWVWRHERSYWPLGQLNTTRSASVDLGADGLGRV